MARAALIIARQFQPGLNIETEMAQIDQLAARALQWPVTDAISLVDFITTKEAFCGNTDDYYNLSNSLLNEVLRTKRGIPITLALVYICIVQRLVPDVPGFQAMGINFPAHFLLAVNDNNGKHLIDPFAGKFISKESCYEIIADLYEHPTQPDDKHFQKADNRQLLRRVLENIKAICLKSADIEQAIECLDFQLMLLPGDQHLLLQQQQLLKHLHSDQNNNKHLLQ